MSVDEMSVDELLSWNSMPYGTLCLLGHARPHLLGNGHEYVQGSIHITRRGNI